MNKSAKMFVGGLILASAAVFTAGCAASPAVADKSGTELWGQNCTRCHNTPPSSAFSNEQWGTIGTHMKERANLTAEEVNKIIAFLQSGS